jgi:hypothetical protein
MVRWLAADTSTATTMIVTSGSWRVAMKAWMTGSIFRVSALLPKRVDYQREPSRIRQQPNGDLRIRPTFLENPCSRNLGKPLLSEPAPRTGVR